MKDLSLFLLKNSLGAKMRRGIRTFCSGNDSTSILTKPATHGSTNESCVRLEDEAAYTGKRRQLPTLEEMILQLEEEEEVARKAKLAEQGVRGRMSCVTNSDILRSARNALNQYPRFSLDGKDAMYRSSFKNSEHLHKEGRKSICCERGLRNSKVGGERVVWWKPGVVAKLMGLEAMPIPIVRNKKEKRRSGSRSCSKTANYYVLNPVAVEPQLCGGGTGTAAWPTARFL